MKVFLAHAKGATDNQIGEWITDIKRWLQRDDIDGQVVPGVQDFHDNIGSDGTFDAWARNVPTRRDTFTGAKLYSAICVPSRTVGKATALIVEKALKIGTPVFVFDYVEKEAVFFQVREVVTDDERNYIAGWSLATD